MGGSAGAIRAGQAFVELFVKDEIAKGLAKAQRTLKSWGNSLSSVGTDLMAGGTAVLAPMMAAVKLFADAGHGLETLSKKTGMSVEWLSAMQYAVGQLGGEFEGFDIGIKKMQSTVADAGRGVGSSVDAIERLGLSVQQVAALSPEQQFMTMGDALSRIQDPAQRAAAAVDIFGRAGTNMLPVFSEGAAGVERFMSRARELGVVMSEEAAKKAGDLAHQMEEVWIVMKSAGNAVAEALVPTLKELGDWISRNVQAFRAWAAEHQAAIQWAFKLAAAAVALGGALVLVSVPLRAIAGIMAGLRAVTIATTAAVHGFQLAMVAASAHPVIAALTVIAAIVAAIAAHFYLAKKAADDFAGAVSDLKIFQPPDVSLAKDAMKSLQDLAGKGPLDAAGMKEAKGSIEDLKGYGFDLGVTIDETTGAILGMDQAWDRFAQSAKAKTLESLEEQIAALSSEISTFYAAEQKANKIDPWSGKLVTTGSDKLRQQRGRLYAARKAIEEMEPGMLIGKPLTTGGVFDKHATREIEREIAREKLATMKDAEAKELALLELEHQDRITKAKEAGADLTKLEELFQVKRTNIVSKYADERRKAESEETTRRAEERGQAADAAWEEAKKRNEAGAGAILDLKKLYIEATKEGRDKELALLEVERDAALKQAFEEGVPREYVDAAFEIRKAMVEAADAGEKQKLDVVGMFSPARLEALGIISPAQERTARASEKISETTKKMLDELMLQRQWNVFE